VTAPAYVAALDRVREAAHKHGKACGLLVPNGPAAAARQSEGWTFITVASDSALLAGALLTELHQARST
jgi:4-hydroxy-2-oxoheptanedioate aldolase